MHFNLKCDSTLPLILALNVLFFLQSLMESHLSIHPLDLPITLGLVLLKSRIQFYPAHSVSL